MVGHSFVLGCADITDWSQFCVGLCRHHKLVTFLCWVVQTSQTSHNFVLGCADITDWPILCWVVQTSQTGHSFVLGCADITDWPQFCVGLCRHHRLATVLCLVVQTSQTGPVICCDVQTLRCVAGLASFLCCAVQT